MKMSYASDCRSRDNADWGRHHQAMHDRRRKSTSALMESLRTSDVSWGLGESIRTTRLAEINTPTNREKRWVWYLQHSEVLPVVSALGPKPTLVGTLRIGLDYPARIQFRMPAPAPLTAVPLMVDNELVKADLDEVMFVRRCAGGNTYWWEVGASLVELALVPGFEFVNGLYKDEEANWVHIQDGVPYLAGSAGSLVVSCRRCGVEQMMGARAWFINERQPDLIDCSNCNRPGTIEPVRMDELHDRWLPFWKLVDGPY